MKYTDIVTNPKTAAKTVWPVFSLCTVIMLVMTAFSGWAAWVFAMLIIHEVLLTVMTFHPKIPVKAQAVVLALLSFSNIFTCSIMENDIYVHCSVYGSGNTCGSI